MEIRIHTINNTFMGFNNDVISEGISVLIGQEGPKRESLSRNYSDFCFKGEPYGYPMLVKCYIGIYF